MINSPKWWVLLFVPFLINCTKTTNLNDSQKNITGVLGDSAMVVTAHPIATEIGFQAIQNGGNAIDAAVATQFALAVVYPRAGNIGGGGFAVVRLNNGESKALDFREMAPGLAHRDMFLNEEGDPVSELSNRGPLAAGVPGSVAGMWELHQKYGSLPWSRLVQPAIDVAYYGFKITQDEAEALNEKQEDFKEANRYKPWAINDALWKAGDLVKQTQLSATLSFIRDLGRDGFYKGIVADQITKEMAAGNGIITKDDLANYQAIWRKPIIGEYRGFQIIGMPPPSSGGIALMQLLQGAELLEINKYAHNSVEAINLMAEIESRVFADRAKYLGDTDFFDVPIEEMLSKTYNKSRFEGIQKSVKTPSSEISHGEMAPYESPETTHFSIVDPKGNAVSITTTLNLNYGCKVWVKGAGFVLNNEMDDFSAKPGVPNFYGLIGNEANAIAPGKRMLSAMTPTIVEKDGQLKMVVGTPGGGTIITTVFQVIRNVIDYDMSMQEAVSAKRIHHQWLPDEIKMESGTLEEKEIKELSSLGHTINILDKIGRADCILVRTDSTYEGGADPRG
ncbi:MAG: gamma-glutamyltransferase, partial [Cyclobacteriaceae bacterium]